jgi:hypothetical protein
MLSGVITASASPRIEYGRAKLDQALKDIGASPEIDFARNPQTPPEGFSIRTDDLGRVAISSADDSGALYGCLELARRIRDTKSVPRDLSFSDAPVFKLRGTCIGMQKTYILPGRKVYEYPYTPELFPFFYDKQFWTEYLDFLAANRFNTLYLWNGHPFASLVKLEDYPYALEVDEQTFAKNQEMFRWIATEADRRGIWVVQMFYNILLSKPFAEKNGLSTQLKEPNPIAADYTRKSIAEFVREYPNVGLMICLGEALQGIDNQRTWLCEVILPGIRDGMRQAGLRDEPPVVIRTHATDLRKFMADALKVYKNIYTEAKFNGESLTTWEPRGVRQQVHIDMSKLGSTHLINVHILANLEPFRYGDVNFIKKSVQAGRDRLGARGLHLYPLCYWDWPISPDKVDPPLQQIHRDWIWFEAWARYSWNPDIEEKADREYWIARLTDMYGDRFAAEKILDAYNASGECAPRILRRFGITEGNRQTMSLGMTLDELVNPTKYRAFEELWESQSPPGERLQEYVDREWSGQPHSGETPVSIIQELSEFMAKSIASIEAATPHVTKNRDEFDRFRNDVHCIFDMSACYASKAAAAMSVLRYAHSHDIADMEMAEKLLTQSLNDFRELVKGTEKTYRFANSMQTAQRRIPITGGVDGKPAYFHWSQMLPVYEKELADFKAQVAALKAGGTVAEQFIKPLPNAHITLLDKSIERFALEPGQRVFADKDFTIKAVAPELLGLSGIRIPLDGNYVPSEFESSAPVKVLIGYFQAKGERWLRPPDLETDAQAIERFEVEPAIQNAITIEHMPAVNVHVMKFPAGTNKIDVRGKGRFVILGVIPDSESIHKRDAKLSGSSDFRDAGTPPASN